VRSGGGDPDTTDGQLAALRVGRLRWVWALAIPPVIVAVIVAARGRGTGGSSRDGLFELLNLVSEESSTERARHGELVRGGGTLGLLIKPSYRVMR
jgi:hypothetical protein